MRSNNVSIGIQARSTSTRFPGKIFEKIDGVEILQHVIDRCTNAATYLNRHSRKTGINVTVHVLCPKDDELTKSYKGKLSIIEGDENDVLSRYIYMADLFKSDYTVRITADCPFIPPFFISKAIKIAIEADYDYFSNVDESIRTSPDGHDVEVMSKKALEYLEDHAKTPEHREHVTLLLRHTRPDHLNMGTALGWEDYSKLKLSVDTESDLIAIKAQQELLERKYSLARKLYGKQNVHRY